MTTPTEPTPPFATPDAEEPTVSQRVSPPPPGPDGLLDRSMTWLFGRSWRTGAIGVLGIAASIVPMIPGLPPDVHAIAITIAPMIPNIGLMLAKDSRVSGLPR